LSLLEATGLTLRYDDALVLDDLSFQVEEGEVVALLGPSGCGKTSILRVLAGLEAAQAGQVRFDGALIDHVASHKRSFGFMFQEFALFPHLNVEQNLEFGLRMSGGAKQSRRERVAELLELVGLAGYNERQVHQLSGGERQRVALARSLAPSPKLLMLDEPMGALDRGLRDALLLELREILTSLGQTSIYVTHDQDEAFSLADRVLIMDAGRIRQSGTPESIFAQPADAFVARFIGLGNLIDAELHADAIGTISARTEIGTFHLPIDTAAADTKRGPATLLLGDERASLESAATAPEGSGGNSFSATVLQRSFRGRRLTFRVETGAHEFLFDVDTRPEHQSLTTGDRVRVRLDPSYIRVLR
jgi:thiamine transport system ATP-binding protein